MNTILILTAKSRTAEVLRDNKTRRRALAINRTPADNRKINERIRKKFNLIPYTPEQLRGEMEKLRKG